MEKMKRMQERKHAYKAMGTKTRTSTTFGRQPDHGGRTLSAAPPQLESGEVIGLGLVAFAASKLTNTRKTGSEVNKAIC